jgi:hypothetical protein
MAGRGSLRIEANMRRLGLCFFSVVLILALNPIAAPGQQWSGIVDPSRAIDWSNAGIPGGIPNRTTICATFNPGASASQINSAISSCPSGQVVFLNAGTYNLSGGIIWNGKSNVTVRGAGADKTLLVFSSGDSCTGQGADVCMRSSDLNWRGGPSNTANWTAGYAKGTTLITLSSTTNLAVGKPLILDQLDDTSDTGGVYVCETGTACSHDGPSGAGRTNRGQIQIVTVMNIAGNQVTISPGLYMPNWSGTKSPGAWWATNPVSADGIEDVSLDHSNTTAFAGIMMFNCSGCWVQGVRGITSDRAQVWLWTSPHAVVRDSYFYGTLNSVSQSYGVESFPASDALVENNIFQQVAAPQNMNGACSGCVFAYNFSIDDLFNNPSSWLSHSSFQHAGGTDNALFEGNNGVGLWADNFHGSHNFITYFRNTYNGWETGKTGNLIVFRLGPFSRYYNLIGNVLGRTGVHNNYQQTPSGGSGNSIYVLGVDLAGISPNDSLTASTVMRWGNYDTVSAANRFMSGEVPSGIGNYANPVPGSQTLPSSFYLSSKPVWWPATKAWPPIGPEVTGGNISGVNGHAYTIPAQDCYSNVMGGPADGSGSVLTFNADNCYTTVARPAPPTGLSISVQ